MKKVGFITVKGGTGKTSVTGYFAKKLSKTGQKVGAVDCDTVKPDLNEEFGIYEDRFKDLNFTSTHLIPIQENGVKLFSLGFYPESERATVLSDKSTSEVVQEMFHTVDWSGIDVLCVDCPPQSHEIAQEVVKAFSKEDGFVIVTTPKKKPMTNALRTKDFLTFLNARILGVIVNMAYVPMPDNTIRWFDYTPEQIEQKLNLPLLSVIPFVFKDDEIERHITLKPILDALNSKPKFSIRGR